MPARSLRALTGDDAAARAALAEAEEIAAAIGAGPDSELSQKLAKLRQALGG